MVGSAIEGTSKRKDNAFVLQPFESLCHKLKQLCRPTDIAAVFPERLQDSAMRRRASGSEARDQEPIPQ
jgi:hypothetical protein